MPLPTLFAPVPSPTGRDLCDPVPWRVAQAGQIDALIAAAFALGQLDADLAALPPDARAGAHRRLALRETGALLSVLGHPMPLAGLAGDSVPTGDDPALWRVARWALRRLEGQGHVSDLRGFLGLHRVEAAREEGGARTLSTRPTGSAFDAAAREFAADLQASALHPLARAPYAALLWRLADLSPDGAGVEPAIWCARDLATGTALPFAPLGRAHLRLLVPVGPPETRLATHLAALRAGAEEARAHLAQVQVWQRAGEVAVQAIKGPNPARILAVLAAHPLLRTAEVAAGAGISRPTAERLLARLHGLGLIREATGAKRFRLWAAKL